MNCPQCNGNLAIYCYPRTKVYIDDEENVLDSDQESGFEWDNDSEMECQACDWKRYAKVKRAPAKAVSPRGWKRFIARIASMNTEEEFEEDASPPSEDWICTMNELIVESRKLLKSAKRR